MSSFLDLNQFDNFQESYFKIEDIISTQEKIVCFIDKPIIDLGYLDPNAESKDLLPGAKLELPLWLAKFLAGHRKMLATVELPKQYSNAQRQILEADATVVDLQKLGPNYYRLGLQLMGFQFHENYDISKSLMTTFQSRLRKIMDLSFNSSEDESNSLKDRLDQTEKLLFECGQKSTKEFSEWESRAAEKMASSNMVVNLRKRKRWQMEEEDNAS